MTDTKAAPEYRVPEAAARLLVDAINAARCRGLNILATSDHGVICVSRHARERWVPAPKIKGLSPIGAAILYVQPEATDVEIAGCVALDISPTWMMGFCAGVAGELPHAAWADHVACQIIGEGYQLGREVRTFLMTEECPLHRIRHKRGTCPLCAEAASGDAGPTPYDPQAGVIGPIPIRERR